MKEHKILVTGSNKGLGLEITHALLENGFTVVGLARNKNADTDALEKNFPGTYI